MPAEQHQLEYGESVPIGRRKLTRRIVITFVFLIGLAASVPLLTSEYRRWRLLRLYSACTRATIDRLPFDGRRLPSGGYAYTSTRPRDWSQLNHELQSNINSRGTLFVGTLKTPTAKREVLVGVDSVIGANPNDIATHVRTLYRGNRMEPVKYGGTSNPILPVPDSMKELKIYFGAVDPNDASHFTIPCDVDGKRVFIDGWLKEDESVDLEWREKATTTAPAPPSPATSRSSDQSPGPAVGRVGR